MAFVPPYYSVDIDPILYTLFSNLTDEMESAQVWSHPLWNHIHKTAKYYKDHQPYNGLQKAYLERWIYWIYNILPCDKCKKHYKQYILQPLSKGQISTYLSNGDYFNDFWINFHTFVNRMRDKEKAKQ